MIGVAKIGLLVLNRDGGAAAQLQRAGGSLQTATR